MAKTLEDFRLLSLPEIDFKVEQVLHRAREARARILETTTIWAQTQASINQNHPRVERPIPAHTLEARRALESLTPRETEVLRLIAEGQSTKQLADTLGITFKTAVTHRTNILAKLKCHETATLVRLAIRAGLVPA